MRRGWQAAMAAGWFVAALAVRAASPLPAEPPPHRYVMTIDAGYASIAVRGCVAGVASPAAVRLRAGPDFGRYVRELRAGDHGLVTPTLDGAVMLPRGERCISYRIDLAAALAAGLGMRSSASRFGVDVRTTSDLWLLAPSLAGRESIELAIEHPPGMAISAPWRRLAPSRFRIDPGPDRAWSAVVAFGRFHVESLDVPGGRIELAVLDGTPSPDPRMLREWIEGIANDVAALHGRFPVPRLQVLLLPMLGQPQRTSPYRPRQPSAVGFGRVVRDGGNAIELQFAQTATLAQLRADWTAHHEFSHLLLPFLAEPGSWIAEGFAGYYQNVLMARAGGYSDVDAWRRLIGGFERGRGRGNYRDSLEEVLRYGGENALMRRYWTGAVVALEVDVALRRRGSSLDALLGELARCCLPSNRAWTVPELFARLDALAGIPLFTGRHERWQQTSAFPSYGPVLEQLGVKGNGLGVRLAPHAPARTIRDAIMGRRLRATQ